MENENKTVNDKTDITIKEAESLKTLIKLMLTTEGYTLDKLANEMNARHNTKESKTNISNKLNRGTFRYIDIQRIANILGYEIELKKPDRSVIFKG